MIKSICHCQDEPEENNMTLVRFNIELMTSIHWSTETVRSYHERFRHSANVYASNDGQLGMQQKSLYVKRLKQVLQEKGISELPDKAADGVEFFKEAVKRTTDEYHACLFIALADGTRFKNLKKNLHNAAVMGRDEYPKTLAAAVNLLEWYQTEAGGASSNQVKEEQSLAFAQPEFKVDEEKKDDNDTEKVTIPSTPTDLAKCLAKYKGNKAIEQAC